MSQIQLLVPQQHTVRSAGCMLGLEGLPGSDAELTVEVKLVHSQLVENI